MKITTIESVNETSVRLTLVAETIEEVGQLSDFATYPRLSGARPAEPTAGVAGVASEAQ
jgi:hypothetical protein